MTEWRTVLVGLGFVGFVALLAYSRVFFGFSEGVSQFTLINASVETVSEAQLKQGDRELALGGGTIEPGQTRTTDFVSHYGSLTLVVKFASGRSMSADNVGYVAAGAPVIVTFEVTDNRVALLTIAKRREGAGRGR